MKTKVTLLLFTYFTVLLFLGSNKEYFAQELTDPSGNEEIQVIARLQRVYWDGEVSEEVCIEHIHSMEELLEKYRQWEILDLGPKKVLLRQQVNDISPLLKANGYFGITSDGTLSIFNGKPERTNIIQSFFQLDIKKLESKFHIELKKGIPIKTKNQYVEVLQRYHIYSKEAH